MNSFKQTYLKNKKKLVIFLSTVLIFTAFLSTYYILFVNITSNDECLWEQGKTKNDSTIITFNRVKVGGVTWKAGIRDGDYLIAINHIKLKNTFQAQEILDKIKSGNYADYTYEKDGKTYETKVYVKKLIQINMLANSLLALMWMLIAFIVLMAKPDGKIQKMFYTIGIATVFISVQSFLPRIVTMEVIKTSPKLYLLAALLITLGASFLPFLLLAFFWIFPKPFKFWQKKWVRITVFSLPVLIFIINVIFLPMVLVNVQKALSFIGPYREVINGYFAFLLLFAALISLIINYRRLETKNEKKSILLILIALAIAIASSIYTARVAPAISDTIFNSPEYYTPIILIILIPIAFAYSIFKYQLMDVSVVIKNTVMYGAATVTLAALYFAIIYLLGQSISEAIGTQFQGILAGIIFIAFAVVFQSSKDKVQDFITARFYPEQFAYQKVLVKFTNDLSTVVGLDNILDTMQKTFVDALMINHFGILIKDKKDEGFQLVRSVGIDKDDLAVRNENLDEIVAQKSLTVNEVVFEQSEFPQVLPDASDNLAAEEIYTVIPMIIKSKTIGMLLFGLKHSGSQFAGKDLELLAAAAKQAAVSIENARLYKSEAEKLEIERDLAIARRIQQGLLPKCIPDTKGLDICGEMIPAMQVGGDYYDLIPVSDSKLFVVVGDVSGKGLAASLYMTKLQTMIQLACAPDKTPREIMIEINRKFYDAIERNSFVTMTLALFDTDTNKVTFCRAGHMPVLTAANGSVHSYRTQGLGVGLEKGTIFDKTLIEEEVELKAGQVYAFFSDGITEAMNETMELFGEDNLSKILREGKTNRSTEIMDKIWKEVNSFRGRAEQNDDMTMVIVKVT